MTEWKEKTVNGESCESLGFTLKLPTYYDTVYLLDYIH